MMQINIENRQVKIVLTTKDIGSDNISIGELELYLRDMYNVNCKLIGWVWENDFKYCYGDID